MEDQVRELNERLNFPSAPTLRAALLKRGVRVPEKRIREILGSRPEREIYAPRNRKGRASGAVVSTGKDHRWDADLMDMSQNPSQPGGQQYILVVQDVFTRRLFAEALADKSHGTVAEAFRKILDSHASAELQQVTTDQGAEFRGDFADLLENRDIPHVVANQTNSMATLDRAIKTIREALARRLQAQRSTGRRIVGKTPTRNWAEVLQQTIRGINDSPHKRLHGDTPNEAAKNKSLQFDLLVRASKDLFKNHDNIVKRGEDLKQAGAFRRELPKRDFEKADQPKHSGEVEKVARVRGATVVTTSGSEVPTRRALPVDKSTARTVEIDNTSGADRRKQLALRPFANRLREHLRTKEGKKALIQTAAEFLRRDSAFQVALRAAGVTYFTAFLRLFPDVFTVNTAANGGTSTVALK